MLLKPYFQFSTNMHHENPLHATPNTTKEVGVQPLDEVTHCLKMMASSIQWLVGCTCQPFFHSH
jgi:hypothetical protein